MSLPVHSRSPSLSTPAGPFHDIRTSLPPASSLPPSGSLHLPSFASAWSATPFIPVGPIQGYTIPYQSMASSLHSPPPVLPMSTPLFSSTALARPSGLRLYSPSAQIAEIVHPAQVVRPHQDGGRGQQQKVNAGQTLHPPASRRNTSPRRFNARRELVDAASPKPEEHGFFILHCSLLNENGTVEVATMEAEPKIVRVLMGSLVSNMFTLQDTNGQQGYFFVFPDLSIRTEGTYRLKFTLVTVECSLNQLAGGESHTHVTIVSDPFRAYTAKKFPGMIESSDLMKCFAQQGLKLVIRKDVKSSTQDAEEGEDLDESPRDDLNQNGKRRSHSLVGSTSESACQSSADSCDLSESRELSAESSNVPSLEEET